MIKETHISFSLLLATILAYYELQVNNPFPLIVLHLVIAAFVSIVPDFDIKSKHRILLHNVWVLIIISVLLFIFLRNIDLFLVFYVIIGYLSHLFLDSLTIKGIKWFYPYIHIKGGVVTNSKYDYILNVFFLITAIIIFSYVLMINNVYNSIPILSNLLPILNSLNDLLRKYITSLILSSLIVIPIHKIIKKL